MRPEIQQIDRNDPEQIAAYEQGFYEAFAPISNPGTRALWIWDDENRRLKTRVPYDHQEIFVIKNEEGAVTSGLAFNMRVEHFQSGEYGFERPADDHIWVETMVIFSRTGKMLHCFEFGRRWLIEHGIDCTYATCSDKVLALYLQIGAKLVGKSEIDSQVRYFLMFPLDKPYFIYPDQAAPAKKTENTPA